MLSNPLASPSDPIDDPAAEELIELELQARREQFALSVTPYIAWVNGALSILLGGLWLLLARPYPQVLIYAVLTLLLALGAGVYPTLQRRNRTTSGLYLVYGLSLLLIALSPLLIPSLMTVMGITDVIAMMAALVLLGDRGSRWLVGALALAYLADVVIVALLGWSPFPPLEHSTEVWVTGAVGLVVILTAVVIVRLIVLGLGQQFRHTQRLNLDLERRIHELNETKDTLSHERNLLRTLIDTVPANVYIKDAQSRFVDANLETALQMGAKTPSDLIGKTDFDFFSPELAGKYFADEQAVLQSGRPLLNIEESNFDRRAQRTARFLTTKVPILNEHAAVTGLVGVSLDITDRVRAQQQVAQERDLLRALIDHLPDYIFIKDADGRFVNSNAAHNRVAHAKDAAELLGKSAVDVFPQPLAAQFEADDQQVLQTGQALVNVERTSLDAEGQERIVLTTKVPLRDATGKVTGLVGISRDITAHKQAQQQAVALAAERQRVTLLREFITAVSHDFRTPLSIIGTSAFLIAKTTDPTKLTAYHQHIEEQISRLTLLMDNFVELAHVEQAASSVLFQSTDLDTLVKTILEQCHQEVAEKRQHVDYRCQTQAAWVMGDPTALSKAISSVLANAIHYTPAEGSITLRLYRQDDTAVIEVTDTGIGIPAVDLPHIFDSFYRVDSARSMQSGGAGLGLSLAKKIVELMKGHIEVESEPGQGSTFRIYFPLP